MATYPIRCIFDGKAFVPENKAQLTRAQDQYGAGEFVALAPHIERTTASHNHYFASIHTYRQNLPERLQMEPWAQTAEGLRKYALIKEGYHNSHTFDCKTKAEAERWAAYLRPIDEFSIVTFDGAVVTRFTAQTQSHKGMPNKGDFQRSKEAVLEFLADLVEGVAA